MILLLLLSSATKLALPFHLNTLITGDDGIVCTIAGGEIKDQHFLLRNAQSDEVNCITLRNKFYRALNKNVTYEGIHGHNHYR